MRIKRLDILRSLAILLVVALHARISPLAERVGWVGVDRFFVLSGFLISNLLYSEYKNWQSSSVRRFFIRRGFKIYPAFYFILLATFIAQVFFWHARPQPLSSFLREIVFVQNYHFAISTHT
jgi:peptidoglycan/LPS O-acetylase OafA/YrhL